ncbi:YbbR-like domain-containing protein [Liquorilactobacillus capillatus]|uniref:YbbR family protein n=1 Tax=Liquorilactobacillus capillatus DSM 19910 TaxID=1423731 RepID=A0A0R1M4E8_9LACO|nr:CdaR family protein [Liquorilactobacillus capillatus]KRL02665.1 YbbR family protein [Liquorilactobacillus capillatus DSM 19910]
MNLNKLLDNRIVYQVLALGFAILLFAYVNSDKLNTTRNDSNNSDTTMMSSDRSETLSVDLKLNVDSNKYFVTGYPSKVKVKLSGPGALVTTTANTRNFSVYADLSKLKPGTHTVRLEQSGINKDLSYELKPQSIKVTISQRETANFPVQFKYDTNNLASNYDVGKPSADQQVASVTGAKKDIDNIAEVIAAVDIPQGTKQTITRQVLLQAVDNSGKILNVVITPQTVRVRLPVHSASTTKKVTLNLVSSGEGVSGKRYRFSSDTKEVTLQGTKVALAKIDKLDVPVSVEGVDNSTDKTVTLESSVSGITRITPKSVKVHIDVTETESSDSNTASASETSTASTSKSETVISDSSSQKASSTSQSLSSTSDSTSDSSSSSSETTSTSSSVSSHAEE